MKTLTWEELDSLSLTVDRYKKKHENQNLEGARRCLDNVQRELNDSIDAVNEIKAMIAELKRKKLIKTKKYSKRK